MLILLVFSRNRHRIGLALNGQEIKDHFIDWTGSIDFSKPINKYYNANPFSSLPVLVGYPGATLKHMRWGLILEWWSSRKLPQNTATPR